MTEFTAIYLRVSTDEQANDGISLAMQEDLCTKYVELHGLPADTIIFRDEGKSATSMTRAGLTDLREGMASGMVKHVVVFKLDRLTRKVGDLCVLLSEAEEHGVSLHGVRDKLDTGTASGRLVLHIMGAVAEWERDTIADRTRAGLAHIRSQGFHVGRPPYGWEAVSHDGPGRLLKPTAQIDDIRKARQMRAEGRSLAAIARELTGSDHPQTGKRIVESPLPEEMMMMKGRPGQPHGYMHPPS